DSDSVFKDHWPSSGLPAQLLRRTGRYSYPIPSPCQASFFLPPRPMLEHRLGGSGFFLEMWAEH
ncbi:MAG: hypothetical protein AAF355_15990, partial [Myxococcota bacterium]